MNQSEIFEFVFKVIRSCKTFPQLVCVKNWAIDRIESLIYDEDLKQEAKHRIYEIYSEKVKDM